jgi:hypothetical protein
MTTKDTLSKEVLKALDNVHRYLNPALKGMNSQDQLSLTRRWWKRLMVFKINGDDANKKWE